MPNITELPYGYRPLQFGEIITDDVLFLPCSGIYQSIKKKSPQDIGQPYGGNYVPMYKPGITEKGNVYIGELD